MIVFTHEMTLVMDLQRQASPTSPISVQHITRLGETVGHVRPSLPWDGLNARERRGDLNEKLVVMRKEYEGRDEDKYRQQAGDFCMRLRQAFERAVEDLVLGGVITRRSDDVHTKQLHKINHTEEICNLVDRGMSDNSPWVHDRPLADGSSPPSPDELQEGLDVLSDLLKAVGELERTRQKDTDQSKKKRVANLKAVELAGSESPEKVAEPHLKPVADGVPSADIENAADSETGERVTELET